MKILKRLPESIYFLIMKTDSNRNAALDRSRLPTPSPFWTLACKSMDFHLHWHRQSWCVLSKSVRTSNILNGFQSTAIYWVPIEALAVPAERRTVSNQHIPRLLPWITRCNINELLNMFAIQILWKCLCLPFAGYRACRSDRNSPATSRTNQINRSKLPKDLFFKPPKKLGCSFFFFKTFEMIATASISTQRKWLRRRLRRNSINPYKYANLQESSGS